MDEIRILKVGSFELLREKREKKIENEKWFLREKELPTTAKDMLSENIKALISFPEAEIRGETGKQSLLVFDTPLLSKIKEKAQSKCFIVDFRDEESLTLLDLLKSDLTNEEFKRIAKKIAVKFREGRYWPKCLLLIAQFKVLNAPINFLVILTTDLKVGEYFTYDPNEIAKMPSGPVYERFLKKGLVFPHIINEKLETEDRVKIYQRSHADYFYDFLSLSHPLSPDRYFSEKYPEISTLDEFSQRIEPQDEHYLKYVPVRIAIDHLRLEGVSYSDLNRKIKFVKLLGLEDVKLVVIRGHDVNVRIGGKELDANFLEIKNLKDLVEGKSKNAWED